MTQIEEIKRAVNMADILSHYGIELNRQNFCQCPLHKEKTPSFSVYADNQKFKCFGCGESGDVITFVMKLENIDFKSAIARIKYDFNIGTMQLSAKPKKEYLDRLKLKEERKKEIEETQKLLSELRYEHCILWNKKLRCQFEKKYDDIEELSHICHKLDFVRFKILNLENKLYKLKKE